MKDVSTLTRTLRGSLVATRRGFTLIELLIVIAIMGSLIGFGVAGYRDFSRRQEVKSAKGQVVSDLRFAQGLADAGEKPSGVACDVPNTLDGYLFSPAITGSDYDIEAVCSGGNIVVKTGSFSSNVTFGPVSGQPTVLFRVLGKGTDLSTASVFPLGFTGNFYTESITVGVGGEIN